MPSSERVFDHFPIALTAATHTCHNNRKPRLICTSHTGTPQPPAPTSNLTRPPQLTSYVHNTHRTPKHSHQRINTNPYRANRHGSTHESYTFHGSLTPSGSATSAPTHQPHD
eukprot:GHVN01035984.1.p1 GENE.GHVN01035984.1~~GHVN01035984.1.p1  ORF type:complete len:112 (-),score=14.14 GHVN01035984.1:916-1251(-)